MTLEELGREYLDEAEQLTIKINSLRSELARYGRCWEIRASKKPIMLAKQIKILEEERRDLRINGEQLVNYYRRD